MKTGSITKISLAAMVVISVTFTACQKEKVAPKTTLNTNLNASAGKNAANALNLSTAASDELQNALFSSNRHHDQKNLGINTSNCAVITYDTAQKPYVETIDYGTGCLGNDGKTRSGKIIVTYDNSDIRVPLTNTNMSFSNYAVNNTPMTGGENIYNNGANTNGNLTFSITENVQVLGAGAIDSVQANYLYEWVAGENSQPFQNLQFSITGSSTLGVSNNGGTFTTTITNPLLKNYVTTGCNFYVQGTEVIHSSSAPDETVDYGNGSCTGMETVTVNGQSSTRHQ